MHERGEDDEFEEGAHMTVKDWVSEDDSDTYLDSPNGKIKRRK